MLVTIEPNVAVLPAAVSVPLVLRPLIAAANAGHPLHSPMQQIMQTMGFSSFMYGVATGQTLQRAQRKGLDAAAHLLRNDSHPFFDRLGDLVKTGPTGTNVMDLHLLLAG